MVTGQGGLLKPETTLSPELEPLRELIASLVFPILRAAGIEDPANAKPRKRNMLLLRGRMQQQTLDQVVRRVSKLAARYFMKKSDLDEFFLAKAALLFGSCIPTFR